METKHNKSRWSVFLGIFVLVVLGAMLVNAGNLNPPGPPAPTMKTLQEIYDALGGVEARIPVQSLSGSGTAMYVISQSGSYYLTGNITGEVDKHGIEITASNVTLDLNGYALIGAGQSTGTTGSGIYASGDQTTVINGNIQNWKGEGVRCSGGNNRTSNVSVKGTGGSGIVGGSRSLVENSKAWNCWGNGIEVGELSIAEKCNVSNNSGNGISTSNGCVVRSCTASYHTLTDKIGIHASHGTVVEGCSAYSNYKGIVAEGSTVKVCTAHSNSMYGIQAWDSLIAENTSYLNTTNWNVPGCTTVYNHPPVP